VRLAPVTVHGVAEEAAFDGVAQRGCRQAFQRALGERAGRAAAVVEQKGQRGGRRELGRGAESAELEVFHGEEAGDGIVDRGGR
jgi:hypothetical protein